MYKCYKIGNYDRNLVTFTLLYKPNVEYFNPLFHNRVVLDTVLVRKYNKVSRIKEMLDMVQLHILSIPKDGHLKKHSTDYYCCSA